ncbi:MAG: hypothetical protein EBX50_03755 [Chitinophagia bacterium]|nr:hypothetical protein [Chitinophagia bacterium]
MLRKSYCACCHCLFIVYGYRLAGSFVAVQESCPHQGVSIAFFANSSTFICPSHGAVFNTAGSNIGGQQTGALKVYAISISGSTLTVTG